MRKFFTIALVFMVFLSFGQRPGAISSLDLQKSTFGGIHAPKTEVDTLIPGNWANATAASVYWFSEDVGYVFGTNTYNDKAYGQQFSVDEPMHVTGGIFWMAYADGTIGDVVFTVWDFVDDAPGEVLGSISIPITDVVGSTSLDGAMVVTFEEPIAVNGDFVVGVDVSGLEAYVPTTKRLGHVSSQIGMGGGLGLVWVKEEDDGWFDVMGYSSPIDVDLAIFPFVLPANGGGDGFSVTFTVDMTGAIAPGGDDPDVTFDPELHNVFVTGDFRDWAQPGSEGSLQLAPVAGKSRATILEEGFEGETFPPTGWLNVDANDDGQSWFHYAVEGSAHTGEKSASSASWTQSTGPITPDNWLVTPAINVANDDYFLEYYVGAQDPDWPAEKYGVFISTTGTNVEDFTLEFSETLTNGDWLLREIDLSAFVGETIYIAFRHYDCNDNFYIKIDDVLVTGTPGGNGGDEIFYTGVANDVAAGQILYKYFIVEKDGDPTWDLGEWIGDPDRSFMVEADVVLNDIWGQQPNVSVDEIQLDMVTKVYPNPVRNTLYIESGQQIDYLRMFDLAGRVVYQAEVMDNQTTIDANLLGGGLYILQMVSGQQVKTHKIQVVK